MKIQTIYIGSRDKTSKSTMKKREQMPKHEKDIYFKYRILETHKSTTETDEEKIKKVFQFSSYQNLFFHSILKKSKRNGLQKLKQIFSENFDGTLIIYNGNAYENGDWYINFCGEKERISFDNLVDTWLDNKNRKQKHLLLILDHNYSGSWCKKLHRKGVNTMSIQSSCGENEKSFEDRIIGSYFLHNLYKIRMNLRDQKIVQPFVQKQTPHFFGDFILVKKLFGIELKFQSWFDMRKCLGTTNFGDWPRVTKKKKKRG